MQDWTKLSSEDLIEEFRNCIQYWEVSKGESRDLEVHSLKYSSQIELEFMRRLASYDKAQESPIEDRDSGIKNKYFIEQDVWFKHPCQKDIVAFRIESIRWMYDDGKVFLIYKGTDGLRNIERVREEWLYLTKEEAEEEAEHAKLGKISLRYYAAFYDKLEKDLSHE